MTDDYFLLGWIAIFFEMLMLALDIAFDKIVFSVFMFIFFIIAILMFLTSYLKERRKL